jgi:hypothetical protein
MYDVPARVVYELPNPANPYGALREHVVALADTP